MSSEGSPEDGTPGSRREVSIPLYDALLAGELALPAPGRGLVVFAHGSGSSRHSPRNRVVANALGGRGLGTLLIDLLTPEEDARDLRTGKLRFDIDLLAAGDRPEAVGAVVSRGGRPDLARSGLASVRAPTLLIVGGDDRSVVEMNEGALLRLRCQKDLKIVAGASHLFREPGALERVAELAGDWFVRHIG